jgi:hypothetical protein
MAAAVIALDTAAQPQPRPTPPRVYSSCLAADTKPLPADENPCET